MAELKRCIDSNCKTTWALGDNCPSCGLGPDGSKVEPKYVASKTELAEKPSTHKMNAVIKPSGLRGLPDAIYCIAVIGFIGWFLIALGQQSWVAFGYGIGTTIACFASGRVIELLQNIDDELYRKRLSE